MARSLFWTSLLFIGYAYFGYPLLLLALSLFRGRPVRKGTIIPTVSFIIAAYNEERQIARKIENTLALGYPADKLEVIVASDCSSDRTDEITRSCEARGVRLVRAPERKGKEHAQQCAVREASGEIIVFSDVATILRPDGVSNIVKNFFDPTVGCVSSVDRFIDRDGQISGEGAYVRYEMLLRSLESRVNTLVGLSGSFFAARRAVCRDWAGDLQSDFNTVLNSVKLGLRGVSDPESIGYYENLADEKKEFDRKVRTVVRGITVLMRSLPLLNPLRYGLFSWQLASHKLCRWLVPFAMLLLLVSNGALALSSPAVMNGYAPFFALQVAFYGMAAVASKMPGSTASPLLRLPLFFVSVNLSIVTAWLKYLKGQKTVAWEPSRR